MVIDSKLVSLWKPIRDIGEVDLSKTSQEKPSALPILAIAAAIGIVFLVNTYSERERKRPRKYTGNKEQKEAAKKFGLSESEFKRIYEHKV